MYSSLGRCNSAPQIPRAHSLLSSPSVGCILPRYQNSSYAPSYSVHAPSSTSVPLVKVSNSAIVALENAVTNFGNDLAEWTEVQDKFSKTSRKNGVDWPGRMERSASNLVRREAPNMASERSLHELRNKKTKMELECDDLQRLRTSLQIECDFCFGKLSRSAEQTIVKNDKPGAEALKALLEAKDAIRKANETIPLLCRTSDIVKKSEGGHTQLKDSIEKHEHLQDDMATKEAASSWEDALQYVLLDCEALQAKASSLKAIMEPCAERATLDSLFEQHAEARTKHKEEAFSNASRMRQLEAELSDLQHLEEQAVQDKRLQEQSLDQLKILSLEQEVESLRKCEKFQQDHATQRERSAELEITNRELSASHMQMSNILHERLAKAELECGRVVALELQSEKWQQNNLVKDEIVSNLEHALKHALLESEASDAKVNSLMLTHRLNSSELEQELDSLRKWENLGAQTNDTFRASLDEVDKKCDAVDGLESQLRIQSGFLHQSRRHVEELQECLPEARAIVAAHQKELADSKLELEAAKCAAETVLESVLNEEYYKQLESAKISEFEEERSKLLAERQDLELELAAANTSPCMIDRKSSQIAEKLVSHAWSSSSLSTAVRTYDDRDSSQDVQYYAGQKQIASLEQRLQEMQCAERIQNQYVLKLHTRLQDLESEAVNAGTGRDYQTMEHNASQRRVKVLEEQMQKLQVSHEEKEEISRQRHLRDERQIQHEADVNQAFEERSLAREEAHIVSVSSLEERLTESQLEGKRHVVQLSDARTRVRELEDELDVVGDEAMLAKEHGSKSEDVQERLRVANDAHSKKERDWRIQANEIREEFESSQKECMDCRDKLVDADRELELVRENLQRSEERRGSAVSRCTAHALQVQELEQQVSDLKASLDASEKQMEQLPPPSRERGLSTGEKLLLHSANRQHDEDEYKINELEEELEEVNERNAMQQSRILELTAAQDSSAAQDSTTAQNSSAKQSRTAWQRITPAIRLTAAAAQKGREYDSFRQIKSLARRSLAGYASTDPIGESHSPAGSDIDIDENPIPGHDDLPVAYRTILLDIRRNGWQRMVWKDDFTMLHWAANKGNTELCKYLMDQKASGDAEDNKGRTPVSIATDNGDLELADMLVGDWEF